jgi:superfamily II DNA helicase RecQ
MMRFHFMAIPVLHSEAGEDELNHFLATHRVLGVERQLVQDGGRSAWALCISYVEPGSGAAPSAGAEGKKARIDYRELLSPEDFAVFVKLRELRKQLAEREGVPPYAVFTNEQLAELVQKRALSQAQLGRVAGIGPSRVAKYGALVVELLASVTRSAQAPAEDT